MNRHPTTAPLARAVFRETVLSRHAGACCNPSCPNTAVDAHHIIERRLWTGDEAGGYYLDNGAAVCEDCHLLAEQTVLSPDQLRTWSGIDHALVPSHLYLDQDVTYTKWGDIELPDGSRLPGPLHFDASVQRILAEGNVLGLYVHRFKYPRTLHLPWSPGRSDDDKVLTAAQIAKWTEPIVLTEKMDGENTTVYSDGTMHARSLTSADHESRHRLKADIQRWCYDLPDGWRVVGENLTAVHSIRYSDLPSIFMVFSIWDGNNCLSVDDTRTWCELLDLTYVPRIAVGHIPIDAETCNRLWMDATGGPQHSEGYVIRPYGSFTMQEFTTRVGKYVRAEHVSSDRHWRFRRVEFNGTV